jgi:hypothetical protein
MKKRRAGAGRVGLALVIAIAIVIAICGVGCTPPPAQADVAQASGLERFSFVGTCDASAIIALDRDRFIVASDEENTLRLCTTLPSPRCAPLFDASEMVRREGDDSVKEVDFEGAARVGDRIYWIGSHGRNKKGKRRADRYSLIATRLVVAGSGADSSVQLTPVGSTYRDLARTIEAAPVFADSKLPKSLDLASKHVPELAPKRAGFNIEGLAVSGSGALLIGLRNPAAVAGGAAIVLEVQNPGALIADAESPRFGALRSVDLAERTVRSLEYEPESGHLYIIGGAIADEVDSRLFVLREDGAAPLRHPQDARLGLAMLNPEGLAFTPSGDWMWIVSDDGSIRDASGTKCKDRDESESMRFRAVRVSRPAGQGW